MSPTPNVPHEQERCGLFRAAASLILLAGVSLVARPTFVFGSEDTDETYNAKGEP